MLLKRLDVIEANGPGADNGDIEGIFGWHGVIETRCKQFGLSFSSAHLFRVLDTDANHALALRTARRIL
jgi:hypothetical protein